MRLKTFKKILFSSSTFAKFYFLFQRYAKEGLRQHHSQQLVNKATESNIKSRQIHNANFVHTCGCLFIFLFLYTGFYNRRRSERYM